MENIDMEEFKIMFSKYCKSQYENGNCGEYDCVGCAVNAAYERIFEYEEEEC